MGPKKSADKKNESSSNNEKKDNKGGTSVKVTLFLLKNKKSKWIFAFLKKVRHILCEKIVRLWKR